MSLLADLNATGDVRMKFSHSLHHFRIRRSPEGLSALSDLATEMYAVFEDHSLRDLERLDAVMRIATSRRCIPAALLEYFGESLSDACGCCSSCLEGAGPRTLPETPVQEISPEELVIVQSIASERKPALATPERLARFLCGIYSPGMMRYRLYQRSEWGMLKRLPYSDVLACTTAQVF
jgi:ATP-dependent DNA helicase RecQ